MIGGANESRGVEAGTVLWSRIVSGQRGSAASFRLGAPRNDLKPTLSNPIAMKKFSCALIMAVFSSPCWLCWAMLTLMAQVRNVPRVFPYFTNLCIVFGLC